MCEVNCMNCQVCAFKESLCDEEFCEKNKAVGSEEDFIKAIERKKGKWIICTEDIDETFHTGSRCSACNYWKPMGIWNFCPNCGAKMEGEE